MVCSQTDPSRFVSGSDDGTVRLWSINSSNCNGILDVKFRTGYNVNNVAPKDYKM